MAASARRVAHVSPAIDPRSFGTSDRHSAPRLHGAPSPFTGWRGAFLRSVRLRRGGSPTPCRTKPGRDGNQAHAGPYVAIIFTVGVGYASSEPSQTPIAAATTRACPHVLLPLGRSNALAKLTLSVTRCAVVRCGWSPLIMVIASSLVLPCRCLNRLWRKRRAENNETCRSVVAWRCPRPRAG